MLDDYDDAQPTASAGIVEDIEIKRLVQQRVRAWAGDGGASLEREGGGWGRAAGEVLWEGRQEGQDGNGGRGS